jgi:hypothetical protein
MGILSQLGHKIRHSGGSHLPPELDQYPASDTDAARSCSTIDYFLPKAGDNYCVCEERVRDPHRFLDPSWLTENVPNIS